MYKITKLIFNEKQGIVCLEMQDEYGNTFNPFISQNKPLSVPNKDKSNLDILTEFCSGKKKEQGINLTCLRKFYEFYKTRATEWKGVIQPEKLWDSWIARERAA